MTTARARRRQWREVKRRPLQGSSPNGRILTRSGLLPSQESLRRSLPRHSVATKASRNRSDSRKAFSEASRNLSVRCRLDDPRLGPGVPPPVGRPRRPAKRRDGRNAPCSSSTMSSDRLFLDRVARQHCPSPLHRHDQTNMHFSPAREKGTFLLCLDRLRYRLD